MLNMVSLAINEVFWYASQTLFAVQNWWTSLKPFFFVGIGVSVIFVAVKIIRNVVGFH